MQPIKYDDKKGTFSLLDKGGGTVDFWQNPEDLSQAIVQGTINLNKFNLDTFGRAAVKGMRLKEDRRNYPSPPNINAITELWFDWFYQCKLLNLSINLRDLAKKMNKKYNSYFRSQYSKWNKKRINDDYSNLTD